MGILKFNLESCRKMDYRQITVKISGLIAKAELAYDTDSSCMSLYLNSSMYCCSGENLFSCFIKLRSLLPHVEFHCKGAKVNVHPSRATSQMSSGLLAYELTLGKQALREDLVNIFDYDASGVTSDPHIQRFFFENWIKSLR